MKMNNSLKIASKPIKQKRVTFCLSNDGRSKLQRIEFENASASVCADKVCGDFRPSNRLERLDSKSSKWRSQVASTYSRRTDLSTGSVSRNEDRDSSLDSIRSWYSDDLEDISSSCDHERTGGVRKQGSFKDLKNYSKEELQEILATATAATAAADTKPTVSLYDQNNFIEGTHYERPIRKHKLPKY